jgi:WD40 repeat protein
MLPGVSVQSLLSRSQFDRYRFFCHPPVATSPQHLAKTRVTGKSVKHLGKDLGRVTALAYSPGGKYITIGDNSGKVIIFDALTGKSVKSLSGNLGRITTLAYSLDDGCYITSSDTSGCSIRWEIDQSADTVEAKLDLDGRLHTTGILSAVATMVIPADPVRAVPHTAVVLDLITNTIVHQQGDAWLLVRQPRKPD